MSKNLNTLLPQKEELLTEVDNISNNDVLEEIVSSIEKDGKETTARNFIHQEIDFKKKLEALENENSKLRIERDRLLFIFYKIQKLIDNIKPILGTK